MTTPSRRLWAAIFAAALAVACSAPLVPPRTDVTAGPALARQAAGILLQLSAYDWALVGGLAGEVERVVSIDRYALVARGSVRAIRGLASETVAATADRSGPVTDRLLSLADGLTTLGNDLTAYADAPTAAGFARVVRGVADGWRRLSDLVALLPPRDETLAPTIARGRSFEVAVRTQQRFAVSVGPYASVADADAAARRVGQVEAVAAAAPFVVRVGTYPDRAAAEAAVAALGPRGFTTAAIVQEEQHSFARGGTAPDVELWREPARIFDTHGAARRVAISPDGAWLATGSDDGTVAIFSGAGTLRALPKFHAGVAHVMFSENGEWLFAGGLTLAALRVPDGVAYGVNVRLPTPATSAVYVPVTRAFVAASPGLAGRAGVIAGRAPDGTPLAFPFPLTTPAGGAVLAATREGEVYIATAAAGGGTDVEVLHVGHERHPRGVIRIPGTIRQLDVDQSASRAAALTDHGVVRFDVRAADPSATVVTVAPPTARAIGFAADGALLVMEPTRLIALEPTGGVRWTVPLTDGRRLVMARRAMVLDGSERLIAVDAAGNVDEMGSGGQVQDLSTSPDGRRVAALVDGRRAVLFTLP